MGDIGRGPERPGNVSRMKRMFAVVALLAALGALFKLALKDGGPAVPLVGPTAPSAPGNGDRDPESGVRARYTNPSDRALVRPSPVSYPHSPFPSNPPATLPCLSPLTNPTL